MYQVAMLVAEAGSDWSAWIDAWRRRSHHLLLLVQHPTEPSDAFAGRVRDRIKSYLSQGLAPERVALVSGDDWSGERLHHRISMLRIVASSLTRARARGTVYVDAPDLDAPHARAGRACQSARALAWAASEQVRGTGVSIAACKPPEVLAQLAAA